MKVLFFRLLIPLSNVDGPHSLSASDSTKFMQRVDHRTYSYLCVIVPWRISVHRANVRLPAVSPNWISLP